MALDLPLFPWHMPDTGKFNLLRLKSLTDKNSFAEKVLRGLKGEQGIVEPTFIYLPGVPGGEAIAKETGVDFFSVPVQLGVRSK